MKKEMNANIKKIKTLQINRIILTLLSFMSIVSGLSQEYFSDSNVYKLSNYAFAIKKIGNMLPQEKVYLHFDNAGYYQGDPIWFQSYVVTSELNHSTQLSKTLYVELLNPGGEIIARQTLPIVNGRCHGNFLLTHLPFYSGFYEVRAYTKYMLNFDEGNIFSRIFPVFDKPQVPGDFAEKNIRTYAAYKYPQKRERSKKAKKINLKFFPEGGNLVKGISSRIAYEATDAYGNPVMMISGTIVDREKNELVSFSPKYEGRGVFTYTPTGEGDEAIILVNEKKYRFDLPQLLPQGFVLDVDNLSSADSMAIIVRKSPQLLGELLGMTVVSRGKLLKFCVLDMKHDDEVCFKLNKSMWPAGVTQITLYTTNGQVLADRLVFIKNGEQLIVSARRDKENYLPFDPVELEFSVRDTTGVPVCVPLSVSIRDGMEEIENRHNILTDLLLMSEIKGYVRRPSYYFEADDDERRTALDQLLLVQGWRRYSWKQRAGVVPFEVKYMPEQGIEAHGQVISMVRGKPRPDVQVSSFLMKRGEEEDTDKAAFINTFDTDSMGRFVFVSNVTGKWNLILSVMEKGKRKDHRIILDRVFNPRPVKYPLTEMQVRIAGSNDLEMDQELPPDTITPEEIDFNKLINAYEDSLARTGLHEKVHRLDEVVVKAKKQSREKDIYNNRAKSIAFYDVASEIDDIKDQGGFIGDDIHELMINMNPHFTRRLIQGNEYLSYKGRTPLFVVNYERTMATEIDYNKYKLLTLESIKAIYINEEFSIKGKYADVRMSPMEADEIYSCVVFIETHPEEEIPARAGKGVRKTWLDGYSEVGEFYQPDYSVLPKEEDYRRTLYWNPELIPDENGNAKIRFYNNSRCRKLKVSAETISANGIIGVYNE